MNFIAGAVVAVFVVLALWHVYMAAFGTGQGGGAVPSVDGKPLFVPGKLATVGVAVVLLGFAVLVAAKAGWVELGLPPRLLTWLCAFLAAGLAARAVGDFRYVGFFKKVTASRFAQLDTQVYSPLCLALAGGVAAVAFGFAGV